MFNGITVLWLRTSSSSIHGYTDVMLQELYPFSFPWPCIIYMLSSNYTYRRHIQCHIVIWVKICTKLYPNCSCTAWKLTLGCKFDFKRGGMCGILRSHTRWIPARRTAATAGVSKIAMWSSAQAVQATSIRVEAPSCMGGVVNRAVNVKEVVINTRTVKPVKSEVVHCIVA